MSVSWGEPSIHTGIATLTNFNGDLLNRITIGRDDLHVELMTDVMDVLNLQQDVELRLIYGHTFAVDNKWLTWLVRDYVPDEMYWQYTAHCEIMEKQMYDIDGDVATRGEAKRGQRDCSMPGVCKTSEAMALGHWGS